MKDYLVIYHAPAEALAKAMDTPPEEAAEGMKEWQKWAEKIGDSLKDMGKPLGFGQKLNVDGSSVESKRGVCGYSMIQAESMDDAKAKLAGHPHLSGWDAACEIEVHESLPLPGM